MLAILAAMGSMALRDLVGTLLTVAEARGRPLLSGALDASYDLVGIVATVLGAGTVITQGVTPHSMLLIGAMCATSFCGTQVWVRLARRIEPATETP